MVNDLRVCARYARARTDPPTVRDLGKWVTTIYWGSSGRRFKSCQPDAGQRVVLTLRDPFSDGLTIAVDHHRSRSSLASERASALLVHSHGQARQDRTREARKIASDPPRRPAVALVVRRRRAVVGSLIPVQLSPTAAGQHARRAGFSQRCDDADGGEEFVRSSAIIFTQHALVNRNHNLCAICETDTNVGRPEPLRRRVFGRRSRLGTSDADGRDVAQASHPRGLNGRGSRAVVVLVETVPLRVESHLYMHQPLHRHNKDRPRSLPFRFSRLVHRPRAVDLVDRLPAEQRGHRVNDRPRRLHVRRFDLMHQHVPVASGITYLHGRHDSSDSAPGGPERPLWRWWCPACWAAISSLIPVRLSLTPAQQVSDR